MAELLRQCLTMDPRQRPGCAALLASPALASRARSLGITLDPDAKNVSHRAPLAAAAAASAARVPAVEPLQQQQQQQQRQPLVEMPSPGAGAAHRDQWAG
jgi:hypothetical protein